MSWRNVLICGVVASAAAVGCKVTVNDCSNGGCPDAGFGSGGETETDAGTGGTKSTGGTNSTGGSGGSSGSSTGGTKSTGGTSSGGSSSTVDSGPASCDPQSDTKGTCAYCIDSKCCAEWLDCAADTDCSGTSSKQGEFACIQACLTNVDSGIMTLDDCAGQCMHDTAIVSSTTSALIACTRDTGDSGTTQNCTQECFLRDLP